LVERRDAGGVSRFSEQQSVRWKSLHGGPQGQTELGFMGRCNYFVNSGVA